MCNTDLIQEILSRIQCDGDLDNDNLTNDISDLDYELSDVTYPPQFTFCFKIFYYGR